MKKILLFILFSFTHSAFLHAEFESEHITPPPRKHLLYNTSILVSSCDKYQELWDPFLTLLFRFWPELNHELGHVPIHFISNKLKPTSRERIHLIQIPHEKSWSDSMLEALDQIKSKYVIILLEDYFLSKPVITQEIQSAIDLMEQQNVIYFQTSYYHVPTHPIKKINDLTYMVKDRYEQYRTSLQACIWRVDALKLILRSGENPWLFETNGSIRSQGHPSEFLTSPPTHHLIHYVNAANLGHINQYTLDFLKSQGLEIKNRTLPLAEDNKLKFWWGHAKGQIYCNVYTTLKNIVRKYF